MKVETEGLLPIGRFARWSGLTVKALRHYAEIGVLQIHFSGGEPTARKDLVELVQHASDVGLYSNLITSAVLLTREGLAFARFEGALSGPAKDAATAAFEVGYESASQFNREYSRFFGQPPMRDVRNLRSPSAPPLELVGDRKAAAHA